MDDEAILLKVEGLLLQMQLRIDAYLEAVKLEMEKSRNEKRRGYSI
jgi:hypothetical protein